MPLLNGRETVDQLIDHFWQNGYMTLRRKFGTYLEEPTPIGKYNVDAVGRFKKKYALGVVITEEELKDERITAKLEFLATRQTKYSNKNVTLFIGVFPENYSKIKSITESLSMEAYKNIKIVVLNPGNSFKENSLREENLAKRFS
ncbi:MAG: hypothetical protein C4539_00105 [Ignavibacteriales bacterium]|nr:MAG: hypothetical protein C4539_00105 [Ignavibacteriales bacterium]